MLKTMSQGKSLQKYLDYMKWAVKIQNKPWSEPLTESVQMETVNLKLLNLDTDGLCSVSELEALGVLCRELSRVGHWFCVPAGPALLRQWLQHLHAAKPLHAKPGRPLLLWLWPLPATGECQELLGASPVPLLHRSEQPAYRGWR